MELYEIKDSCRSNFNKYLIRAFEYIPAIEDANVLDMGCGTGVSDYAIAEIFNYRITAVDLNEVSLNILKKKIVKLKYPERISIVHSSIKTAKIPEKNFNIILAEGLFNSIGFEKGLSIASSFLANNGYMIIHDEFNNEEMKLELFRKHHFKVITSFILNEKVWWEEYISCMKKHIEVMKKTMSTTANTKKIFERELYEIELYEKEPMKFRSIYYVIQKL